MRLFRRKHDPHIPAATKRSRTPAEAKRSIEEQRAKYEAIKADTPLIAALGKSLKELHEHNHIAENLTAIIGGKT